LQRHVALTEAFATRLERFLLGEPEDEEICFALWNPVEGRTRYTAALRTTILPGPKDRVRHGTVEARPEYLDRAKEAARERGMGLALVHSHPFGRGWQPASGVDFRTEHDRLAREVGGVTGLPLVGVTLAGDGSWSARLYPPGRPRGVSDFDCDAVRVVGPRLRVHFNPHRQPPPEPTPELRRTASVWGAERQRDLMRLCVGVIGAGSVGSALVEMLARAGVGELDAMDFDRVERGNLDRLWGARRSDARRGILKGRLARRRARTAATTPGFVCRALETSVVEEAGYRSALDCDVLFSAVDRYWPRQVLNHLSYTSLIPVIDGGVSFRRDPRGRLAHGVFRAQTVGPGRACLNCSGAIDAAQIPLEREGRTEDPRYLEGLDGTRRSEMEAANQNVIAFSTGLASLELLQFIELTTDLAGRGDLGRQQYDCRTGEISPEFLSCHPACEYRARTALGSRAMPFLAPDPRRVRSELRRESDPLASLEYPMDPSAPLTRARGRAGRGRPRLHDGDQIVR
jgi:proteasome lid subunit RPN8/RPN11